MTAKVAAAKRATVTANTSPPRFWEAGMLSAIAAERVERASDGTDNGLDQSAL